VGLLLRRRPAIAARTATGTPKVRGRDHRPGAERRLHILEVQRLIRFHAEGGHLRRAGWAAAAGTACTSSATSPRQREHARFKQTDADVASFDGGFGSATSPAR